MRPAVHLLVLFCAKMTPIKKCNKWLQRPFIHTTMATMNGTSELCTVYVAAEKKKIIFPLHVHQRLCVPLQEKMNRAVTFYWSFWHFGAVRLVMAPRVCCSFKLLFNVSFWPDDPKEQGAKLSPFLSASHYWGAFLIYFWFFSVVALPHVCSINARSVSKLLFWLLLTATRYRVEQ